ncbi:MAG: LPXTG cell wall anchor domain-containing protein [Patescibacteria group bacterium]
MKLETKMPEMPKIKLLRQIIVGLVCLLFLVSPAFSFASTTATTRIELRMNPSPLVPEEEILPPNHPVIDISSEPVAKESRNRLSVPILATGGILLFITLAYIIYRRRKKKIV